MAIRRLKKRPAMTPAQARLAFKASIILIIVSLVIVAARIFIFGTNLLPEKETQLWNLETKISVTGGEGEGKASVIIPGDDPGQLIIEERVMSLGHQYTFRNTGANRLIEISVGPGDSLKSYYRATLKVGKREPVAETGKDQDKWIHPRGELGSLEGGLLSTIASSLPGAPGSEEAARAIYDYIRENFDTSDEQPAEGDQTDREMREARLLFQLDLAKAKGIPSRRVTGFIISKEGKTEPVSWVEHLIEQKWEMSIPEMGWFGTVDDDLVILSHDETPQAYSKGLKKLAVSYRLWRDLYGHHDIQGERTSGLTGRISLERLPVDTQKFIKVLLLAPLAALIVVVAKTILGIETVGTFLPVILALSWRNTELAPGILMLTVVLMIGMAALVLFRRMGIPRVPSTALMVAVVVLTLAYLSLAGEVFDIYRLGNIAFFPIIIMTLLVERISGRFVDDGMRGMLKIYSGTVAVAAVSYLVMTVAYLQNLMLRFPELTVMIMGLIILAALAARKLKLRRRATV